MQVRRARDLVSPRRRAGRTDHLGRGTIGQEVPHRERLGGW